MAIIKAGYRLTVKSWENDWDNHNTVVKEGLALEDVKFIVKILMLYKDKFANIYSPTDKQRKEEIIELRKIVEQYPNAMKIFGLLEEEDLKEDDAITECTHSSILYEYMGGGDFYTRKCESYKVEYIPFDITIEDVTTKLFLN